MQSTELTALGVGLLSAAAVALSPSLADVPEFGKTLLVNISSVPKRWLVNAVSNLPSRPWPNVVRESSMNHIDRAETVFAAQRRKTHSISDKFANHYQWVFRR